MGAEVRFAVDYAGLLGAMTSPFVTERVLDAQTCS